MGFLDKLKNTFFEEEYVEVEEKPKKHVERVEKVSAPKPVVKPKPKPEVKKEVISVPTKREERRESPVTSRVQRMDKPISRTQPIPVVAKEEKKTEKFNYFDDDDFLDLDSDFYKEPASTSTSQKSIKTEKPVVKESTAYNNPGYSKNGALPPAQTTPTYTKEEKKVFKPTPIISPIYLILDKNYTKEELNMDRKEIKPSSSYVSKRNVDLDSVREKAYGSMTNDFGLIGPEEDAVISSIVESKEEDIGDNLLYDMTEAMSPVVDKVTLQDAEEYFQDLGLEYNVDYKDAKHEKVTGRKVAPLPNPELDDVDISGDIDMEMDMNNVEIDPFMIEEEKKFALEDDIYSKEDSGTLEDNLFDLIDSMYEEKE